MKMQEEPRRSQTGSTVTVVLPPTAVVRAGKKLSFIGEIPAGHSHTGFSVSVWHDEKVRRRDPDHDQELGLKKR